MTENAAMNKWNSGIVSNTHQGLYAMLVTVCHKENASKPPWSCPCTQRVWRTDLYQQRATADRSDMSRRGTRYVRVNIHCSNNQWTHFTTFFLIAVWWSSSSNVTIRYDVVYLTCSKKLTYSQLSPPHGTNRKIKETNKLKINQEAW